MKRPAMLTVIGSGTLVPSADRASASHLLEVGDRRVLMDVGPGAVHGLARHGRPWWMLTHVVLSHYHTDHFGDLPHLLFAMKWGLPAPRTAPLAVIGPPGLRHRVEGLRRAHGDFILDPGFDVQFHEVPRSGTWTSQAGSLSLYFAPTPHTDASMAVRVEDSGVAVGYTGDTGPCPELGTFFEGVGVLVSECGHADPPPTAMHLSPRSVAEIARVSNPDTLVLTHLYPPLTAREAPELVRRAGFEGTVVAAYDGQCLELDPS